VTSRQGKTIGVLAAAPFLLRVQAPVQPIPPIGSKTPVAGYVVRHVYPHDRQAFTQGLQYHDGFLYEGTGQEGLSSIRKLTLATGRPVQQVRVPSQHFGEGITLWNDQIIQLTWRSQIGFVYDRATLVRRRSFSYTGEGWGLTHDGRRLIMSDGTARLRFLNPETLEETGTRLLVTDAGIPIKDLNELEWVGGEIYANVWRTNFIARISPATGRVRGWVDLSGLLTPAEASQADVLNGIAYDAAKKRLFVTGKLWPKLFEIDIC
jgi:glutaminyl-peptide cyclotransferase